MLYTIEVPHSLYLFLRYAFVLCMFITLGMGLTGKKRTYVLVAFDVLAVLSILFIFEYKDVSYVIASGAIAHVDFKKQKPKN